MKRRCERKEMMKIVAVDVCQFERKCSNELSYAVGVINDHRMGGRFVKFPFGRGKFGSWRAV